MYGLLVKKQQQVLARFARNNDRLLPECEELICMLAALSSTEPHEVKKGYLGIKPGVIG